MEQGSGGGGLGAGAGGEDGEQGRHVGADQARAQVCAPRAYIATAGPRTVGSLSRSASYSTGAARTALRVNTPAVAQLVALTSNATSGAPSALSPTCAAAAEKPRGDVTEPSGSESNVAVIGG